MTQRDRRRWDENAPNLPGWTRKALDKDAYPWNEIPDEVADEVDRPLLIEWQPSYYGGWGMAAVWWPNEPTET